MGDICMECLDNQGHQRDERANERLEEGVMKVHRIDAEDERWQEVSMDGCNHQITPVGERRPGSLIGCCRVQEADEGVDVGRILLSHRGSLVIGINSLRKLPGKTDEKVVSRRKLTQDVAL